MKVCQCRRDERTASCKAGGAALPLPCGSEGWPKPSARAGCHCFLFKSGILASMMDLILLVLLVNMEVTGEGWQKVHTPSQKEDFGPCWPPLCSEVGCFVYSYGFRRTKKSPRSLLWSPELLGSPNALCTLSNCQTMLKMQETGEGEGWLFLYEIYISNT